MLKMSRLLLLDRAMDSRMTICGDFAENDANINTEYKPMFQILENFTVIHYDLNDASFKISRNFVIRDEIQRHF